MLRLHRGRETPSATTASRTRASKLTFNAQSDRGSGSGLRGEGTDLGNG